MHFKTFQEEIEKKYRREAMELAELCNEAVDATSNDAETLADIIYPALLNAIQEGLSLAQNAIKEEKEDFERNK